MRSVSQDIIKQFNDAARANSEAVVCILDSDRQLLRISPSVSVIHGYSQAEVVGRNFAEFFDADDVTHLNLVIQDVLLTGESIVATRRVRHKSGSYRRMRGGAKRLDNEHNGGVYIVSIGLPYE